MARLARLVVPGLAHHVTQRGNRREAIFFEDGHQGDLSRGITVTPYQLPSKCAVDDVIGTA